MGREPPRGAGEGGAKGRASGPFPPLPLFGRIVLVKAYGLAVLYLLFLRTPARERIETSFLCVRAGQTRTERVEEISSGFFHRLTAYDGQWTLDIAERGYRRLPPPEGLEGRFPGGNYAFFPLLPLLLRALEALGVPAASGGVVLTLLLSALGVALSARLARSLGIPPAAVAALLLAWPAAAFQYALYTEGLFLCLSALALLAALRRDTPACALLGALCGLTRPQGVLLALPFAWELGAAAWREGAWGRRRLHVLLLGGLATLAPLSGFAAMAWVSLRAAGRPLAFVEVQSAWGRSHEAGSLLQALGDVSGYTGPPADLLGLLFGLGLVPVLWRRLPPSLALYGTAAVLMPLATGSILSLGRFLSVSIPHFLALASLVAPRPRILVAVAFLLAALQVLLAKGLLGWAFVG